MVWQYFPYFSAVTDIALSCRSQNNSIIFWSFILLLLRRRKTVCDFVDDQTLRLPIKTTKSPRRCVKVKNLKNFSRGADYKVD